jgi:hypothetical protein
MCDFDQENWVVYTAIVINLTVNNLAESIGYIIEILTRCVRYTGGVFVRDWSPA